MKGDTGQSLIGLNRVIGKIYELVDDVAEEDEVASKYVDMEFTVHNQGDTDLTLTGGGTSKVKKNLDDSLGSDVQILVGCVVKPDNNTEKTPPMGVELQCSVMVLEENGEYDWEIEVSATGIKIKITSGEDNVNELADVSDVGHYTFTLQDV